MNNVKSWNEVLTSMIESQRDAMYSVKLGKDVVEAALNYFAAEDICFALKEGCLASEDAMLLLQTSSLKSIIDRFNHMNTHRMDDIRAAIHAEVYERKKELLKNGGADADI